jgi:heme/copper-type cytochrome/quinol oxidase subunit 3
MHILPYIVMIIGVIIFILSNTMFNSIPKCFKDANANDIARQHKVVNSIRALSILSTIMIVSSMAVVVCNYSCEKTSGKVQKHMEFIRNNSEYIMGGAAVIMSIILITLGSIVRYEIDKRENKNLD